MYEMDTNETIVTEFPLSWCLPVSLSVKRLKSVSL